MHVTICMCVCLCVAAALEVNGVSILNGDFNIDGTSQFTAAGNVFQYELNAATETILTTGPLVQPLTLQVGNYISCTYESLRCLN